VLATPDRRIIDGVQRVSIVWDRHPDAKVPVRTLILTDDRALALRFHLARARTIPTAPAIIAIVRQLAPGRTPGALAKLLGIPTEEARVMLRAASEVAETRRGLTPAGPGA